MRFAAVFSILVGVLMLGQWAFFLVTRNVPELETAPRQINFRLAAEFMTAFTLILGGVVLLALSLVSAYFLIDSLSGLIRVGG